MYVTQEIPIYERKQERKDTRRWPDEQSTRDVDKVFQEPPLKPIETETTHTNSTATASTLQPHPHINFCLRFHFSSFSLVLGNLHHKGISYIWNRFSSVSARVHRRLSLRKDALYPMPIIWELDRLFKFPLSVSLLYGEKSLCPARGFELTVNALCRESPGGRACQGGGALGGPEVETGERKLSEQGGAAPAWGRALRRDHRARRCLLVVVVEDQMASGRIQRTCNGSAQETKI